MNSYLVEFLGTMLLVYVVLATNNFLSISFSYLSINVLYLNVLRNRYLVLVKIKVYRGVEDIEHCVKCYILVQQTNFFKI